MRRPTAADGVVVPRAGVGYRRRARQPRPRGRESPPVVRCEGNEGGWAAHAPAHTTSTSAIIPVPSRSPAGAAGGGAAARLPGRGADATGESRARRRPRRHRRRRRRPSPSPPPTFPVPASTADPGVFPKTTAAALRRAHGIRRGCSGATPLIPPTPLAWPSPSPSPPHAAARARAGREQTAVRRGARVKRRPPPPLPRGGCPMGKKPESDRDFMPEPG